MPEGQIILEEYKEEKPKDLHPNTPEEQQEITDITAKVNKMYELQAQSWREFNDRTLRQYVDDNEKRINNYVPPRDEDFDDWQTKGFEGVTREKMFAFVSKVAMERPDFKFKATNKRGELNKAIADIVGDFSEYSHQLEDPTSVEFFYDAWVAAGHGTCIRYEGVEQDTTIEEEFDDYDVATGKITGLREKTIEGEIHAKGRRVRLTDFLWYDWYEPDIQKQPCIAEVSWMNRFKFEEEFGGYYNADQVPDLAVVSDLYGDSFYMNQWADQDNDMICVTRYYEKCKGKTKFRIIANGVLILATPIPRKDGKYPYEKGIAKPHADPSFFCGKALPDEIAWDQDLYNAIKNMVVDRAILHLNRPLITDGSNEFTDVFMSPNKILNVVGNVQQLDIQGPSQDDMAILEMFRQSMDRQTTDVSQSGQSGSGSTAREIVIANEHARKLAGVFRLFLEDFALRLERLRVGTILQFYFEPSKIDAILDEDDGALVYRTISIPNRRLSDGVMGTKVISIVGSQAEVPSAEELNVDVMEAKLQGLDIDKVVINAEYIKNFNLDVAIIPESSFESSRSLELALESEYQKTIATLYPQKFQEFQEVFFRSINEIYEKDMSEFEGKQKPQQAPVPQLGQPQTPTTTAMAQPPTLPKLAGLEM